MQDRKLIEDFLAQDKMALAGASRSGKKFGNTILKTLMSKGYKIRLLHPEMNELEGLRCYPSLEALPREIENLILVIPPERALEMVNLIPASGIKRVWMQQGSESPEAIDFCNRYGVDVVAGECILMFAEPKGLHKFHSWLNSFFGKGHQ
ncbi:MAG: CoA-binding protein [Candidatus Marinimicrobia bacterium]|nr:CoA-binding protein [Candidatus Neomarinimicrobiota bacterium]